MRIVSTISFIHRKNNNNWGWDLYTFQTVRLASAPHSQDSPFSYEWHPKYLRSACAFLKNQLKRQTFFCMLVVGVYCVKYDTWSAHALIDRRFRALSARSARSLDAVEQRKKLTFEMNNKYRLVPVLAFRLLLLLFVWWLEVGQASVYARIEFLQSAEYGACF